MRKHLYFHSSNFDQIKELRHDLSFESVIEYPPIPDRINQHQYEYGRIKTATNYYHFIFGNLQQEGCPWCGGPGEIIEGISTNISPKKFVIQCKQCGARGPIMNVSHTCVENREVYHEIVALMWQRFKTRRPWDHGFINRYELYNSSQADEKINSEK